MREDRCSSAAVRKLRTEGPATRQLGHLVAGAGPLLSEGQPQGDPTVVRSDVTGSGRSG